MRPETRSVLRQGQEKLKKAVDKIGKEVHPSWLERQVVKLYLKSPPKVQYALAKYGIKRVIKKKKADLEEMIKH